MDNRCLPETGCANEASSCAHGIRLKITTSETVDPPRVASYTVYCVLYGGKGGSHEKGAYISNTDTWRQQAPEKKAVEELA